MNMIFEMLSYPFVVRALVGGILVSLCCALLGVSLVLKRYSMIGDGLSHVSFGALSIAVAAGWSPLKVSIPLVVLAAFFLLRITEHGKVKSDAAIAMISASSLAVGIIVTSLTTGMTTDVSSIYVRKYPGYEPRGRDPKCCAVHHCTVFVCVLLQQAVCGYL